MNITKMKNLFAKCTDKQAAAAEIGVTYAALYNVLNKGAIPKVNLIEGFAKYFNVPVGYFFDEEITDLPSTILEAELREKNAQIDRLLSIIETLQGAKKTDVA